MFSKCGVILLQALSINQIEKYDWDLQAITLTQQGTEQLAQALVAIKGTNSAGVAKLKNLKENLGWGNPIERALYTQIFIVLVNDQFKYGGIFLDATSQMAIDFPVARVTISEGKAVIALLPTHLPFVMIDLVDGDGNLRHPAIAEEAQEDIMQQQDFFSQWIGRLATTETSVRFRAIIRDEAIRLWNKP